MSCARKLAAAAAFSVSALVAAPTIAAAGTSHSSVWETKTVICGIESAALSKTEVLCQATGVPRPPYAPPAEPGDPGVVLAAHGKPQLVLISQDSYPPNSKVKKLSNGTVWGARGVTCTIARKTVTCKNRSKHGFTIGNGKYKHF